MQRVEVNRMKPGSNIRSNQASNNPRLNRGGDNVVFNNINPAGQTYPVGYYVQPSCSGLIGCGIRAINSFMFGGF